MVLDLQEVFEPIHAQQAQHGIRTAAISAQPSANKGNFIGVNESTNNLARVQQLIPGADQSELTATESNETDAAGCAMTPAVPGRTTAVDLNLPEGSQLLQPQLSPQPQLESLVERTVHASTSAPERAQPSLMLGDRTTDAEDSCFKHEPQSLSPQWQ